MEEVPGNSEPLGMPHNAPDPNPVVQPPPQQPRNYDELIARVGEKNTSAPKPPPAPPTVPAGWYPDPENATGFRYGSTPSLRYFDGIQWTDQRAPMPRHQNRQGPSPQPVIVNQQFAPPQTVYVSGGSSSMAGLHLLLTIFTCGLWLPVWILIEIVQAISKR